MPSAIVKKNLFKLINKKPILPSAKELNNNPPSRSAKLRYAIKINEGSDFSEFLKKFQNLLDIEDLSEEYEKNILGIYNIYFNFIYYFN